MVMKYPKKTESNYRLLEPLSMDSKPRESWIRERDYHGISGKRLVERGYNTHQMYRVILTNG